MVHKPSVLIVTPALASARNGNWQTARRWASLLGAQFNVRLRQAWDGSPAHLMLALHARRSADAIAAWAATGRPLVVVLTGTDLYRDIADDAAAQRSLALADRLLVLQDRAPLALPPALRDKAVVCYQSTTTRQPQAKARGRLNLVAVGHLRAEKSPRMLFELVRRLAGDSRIRLDHIGSALDPSLGAEAAALAASNPLYRWLGSLPHEAVRRRIARAHLLVHPSIMEGGAHVIMEAACSGTAVLASRVDGNVGMLGADYDGYFPPGDVDALAALVRRCRDDPSFLGALLAQCAARAPLFSPERERATLVQLIGSLLERT
jgi:putative glycosyltransferase (TIGR04348 family)